MSLMRVATTVKQNTPPETVSDKSNLAHVLKCSDFMPKNWHKIPSSVQYALIEIVGNKRRKAFDLCLKRYGVGDTSSQDKLWSIITDQMNCLGINDSNNTNANHNPSCIQNNQNALLGVDVDGKRKTTFETVRNVSGSEKAQSVITPSNETNDEDWVRTSSHRSGLRNDCNNKNENQKCQRRLESIPRRRNGVRHGQRTDGKVHQSLSFGFQSSACPKSDSITCEKSETYVIQLKPPAKEPLMFTMGKNNSGGWYQCQNRALNQHHAREDKEDIFICV